ncbi:MAG: hypothetical protein DHS20C05_09840 [Hyphococcus sp.]|nr:MAG: hypothetical protein DHS20C05_09840 [Marinicaulis sp.]
MSFRLLFGLFALLATMPASARDLDAKFLIKHKGKVIGHHIVDVRNTEFGTVVDTKIEMRVKFGPIPVFKYDHTAREVWRDDKLISLVSNTDNNGEVSSVDAKYRDGGLYINGSEYEGMAPANSAPSSYWDKSVVDAEALINTQTGEIIDIEVENLGETLAPHDQTAEHYRLTGTVALNIWYEGERWVGSNFIVDGEELTYVLAPTDRQYASSQEYLD